MNKLLFSHEVAKTVYLVSTTTRMRCWLCLAKKITAIKLVKPVKPGSKGQNIAEQA